MEDDSKSKIIVNSLLGAVGLGAVAAFITVPKYGIWLALAIVLLAVLLFGAYFLYRRMKARRQSRGFESAIENQTAASPRAISDPNRRAALDKLRQKFQSGMQEFKSRGKDIYKLPWYVIIGEPGSGKSEAIRHSGIDFPPGLQDELQGSGGTVNMDWWFTNRSIILDTAGSMIFNESQAGEAPEWREFLRLLKKARPNCPVNGLFLVLSVESLIKDSADKIAQKASKLAQQLDLIQRTLDVRFPVYLLVTKCDLLTGFREFFDNIEDPLLQHQMFGWSNPEPLDAHFRPELVEQHLKIVAERIRRRRMALLRESSEAGRFTGETQYFSAKGAGSGPKRRLDDVDSLFALPESVMRLAPRLQRYLETIFVAGEWSAKPVFLRGIYFTSSMREGHALDEAMALASGVALEQLPEDRPWDKNRSYFMRDLFVEKVFRENGLVTRATNTLQLLRKRRLLIFGVASGALLLLLVFAFLASRGLNKSVQAEASYWKAGATNWNNNNGEWSPPIVRAGSDSNLFHFTYAGSEPVTPLAASVVQYHQKLHEFVETPLDISFIFKPIAWMSAAKDMNRSDAQRLLFEGGVLRPLVNETRSKMERPDALSSDPVMMSLHREALLSLIRLESDNLAGGGILAGTNAAAQYLTSFQSYLVDAYTPADTNLVGIMVQIYASGKKGAAHWPPPSLLGGDTLEANKAIKNGLAAFRKTNLSAQNNIEREVGLVAEVADSLHAYQQVETEWLAGKSDPCAGLGVDGPLSAVKQRVDAAWRNLRSLTNPTAAADTNLTAHYELLEQSAGEASAGVFKGIADNLPSTSKTAPLFADINHELKGFADEARETIQTNSNQRAGWLGAVDRDELAPQADGRLAWEARWNLYTNSCALAGANANVTANIIGNEWARLNDLQTILTNYDRQLAAYHGPLVADASNICQRIAGDASTKVRGQLIDNYTALAVSLLQQHFDLGSWASGNVEDSQSLLDRLERDLKAAATQFDPSDLARLQPVSQCLLDNAARLPLKIGFPVMLNADADKAMSPADLASLRNMLPPVMAALKDPYWTGLLNDVSAKRPHLLAKNLGDCNEIISALMGSDGKFATVTLFFLPPETGADEIINDYRDADAIIGDADSGWLHLDQKIEMRKPFPMGNGTIDGGLKISFKPLGQLALTPVNLPAWALIRLIQDAKNGMQRDSNGKEWTWTVTLTDPQQQGVSGPVALKILTEHPLPKPEDWPKD